MVVTRNELGDNRVGKPACFMRRLTMRLMSVAVSRSAVSWPVRRMEERNSGEDFSAVSIPAAVM